MSCLIHFLFLQVTEAETSEQPPLAARPGVGLLLPEPVGGHKQQRHRSLESDFAIVRLTKQEILRHILTPARRHKGVLCCAPPSSSQKNCIHTEDQKPNYFSNWLDTLLAPFLPENVRNRPNCATKLCRCCRGVSLFFRGNILKPVQRVHICLLLEASLYRRGKLISLALRINHSSLCRRLFFFQSVARTAK